MRSTNSHGNDNRGVRRFLREVGKAPTVANVEIMSRELRRSQTENERVVERAKERGGPSLRDERGDVAARVKARVERELRERNR